MRLKQPFENNFQAGIKHIFIIKPTLQYLKAKLLVECLINGQKIIRNKNKKPQNSVCLINLYNAFHFVNEVPEIN